MYLEGMFAEGVKAREGERGGGGINRETKGEGEEE